jgi:hypothetical protein
MLVLPIRMWNGRGWRKRELVGLAADQVGGVGEE